MVVLGYKTIKEIVACADRFKYGIAYWKTLSKEEQDRILDLTPQRGFYVRRYDL